MCQHRAITIFASGECRQEFRNPAAEVHWQAQDGAELDDNGVHLPVAIREADVKQRLGNAQMRSGTDRNEFGEAFDNSQHERQQVIVQASSKGMEKVWQKSPIERLALLVRG